MIARIKPTFLGLCVGICVVGCLPYSGGPAFRSAHVPNTEPSFVVTIRASDWYRGYVATSTGPNATSTSGAWPYKDVVIDEFDLVSVTWPTKQLVFLLDDPELKVDAIDLSSHSEFTIQYNTSELAAGTVHIFVPASGKIDGQVMFVQWNESTEGRLAVQLYDHYRWREPLDSQRLLLGDPALDSAIGAYLNGVVAER